MSKKTFETYKDMFEVIGDNLIYPQAWGECLWPITIEELYQHFRDRLLNEPFESMQDLKDRE